MESWLQERRPAFHGKPPQNGEEMSLSRVGRDLYEKVRRLFLPGRKNNLFFIYSIRFSSITRRNNGTNIRLSLTHRYWLDCLFVWPMRIVILLTPMKGFPNTATQKCFVKCYWLILISMSGLTWTTLRYSLTLSFLMVQKFKYLFQVKSKLPPHKVLIFTGPIDAFYASQGLEKLEYRSIYFEV